MNDTELLPCPFCEAPARLWQNRQSEDERLWWWDAACTNRDDCEACITGFASKDAAIAKWNRRHVTPQTFADFYNRVCDRAERNMELTNTVSGAHWLAMRQELKSLGIEVTR